MRSVCLRPLCCCVAVCERAWRGGVGGCFGGEDGCGGSLHDGGCSWSPPLPRTLNQPNRDDYKGVKKFRFYMKCIMCNREITFVTDPENMYVSLSVCVCMHVCTGNE